MPHTITDDWRRVVNHTSREDLVPWARSEPALAGLDLQQIVSRARAASTDLAGSDAVLAALFRLGSSDPLARRAVLEAVTPRLVAAACALSRTLPRDPVRDIVDDLAGRVWELAGDAAGRWSSHLAVRLIGQARRSSLADRRRHGSERLVADPPAAARRSTPEDAQTAEAAIDVVRLLDSCVGRGVITPRGAQVLMHVANGLTVSDIANRRGEGHAAVRRARLRALQRLRREPGVIALRVR